VKKSRIAGAVVVVGGLVFGFAGGEYSTPNWLQLRHDVATEQAALSRLDVDVDSLKQVAHDVETDPATQERLAREQFGMLRPGELMFQIVPAKP